MPQRHELEVIQDQFVERVRMNDRIFMLRELDPDGVSSISNLESEFAPGDPNNFVRTIAILGQMAAYHRAWSLVQHVSTQPDWREQVDSMATIRAEA